MYISNLKSIEKRLQNDYLVIWKKYFLVICEHFQFEFLL